MVWRLGLVVLMLGIGHAVPYRTPWWPWAAVQTDAFHLAPDWADAVQGTSATAGSLCLPPWRWRWVAVIRRA